MVDLLEVIEMVEIVETGEMPAAVRPRPGDRWVWLVLALAGLLFFVAGPLRLSMARSEVLRLEAQWRSVQAVEAGRRAVATVLAKRASPADGAMVAAATGATNREAQVLLRRLSAAVRRDMVFDSGVGRLRGAVERAVAAVEEVPGPDAPGWAAQRAEQLLDEQLQRFGLKATPIMPPWHLEAADKVLGVLGHILDQPGHGRLLGSDPSGLVIIDVNRDTVHEVQVGGLPVAPADQVLVRAGWIAVLAQYRQGAEELFSVPASLDGTAVALGHVVGGPFIYPGHRADTVWVQRAGGMVQEITGSGQIVTGPLPLPDHGQLAGVVHAGLVVATKGPPGRSSLTIWDPYRRQAVRVIGRDVLFVSATGGDTVAWVTAGGVLRFTAVATGAVATVVTPRADLPSGNIGTLSPDGRYFAMSVIDGRTSGPLPVVVDTTTAATRVAQAPAGSLFDIAGFVWGPAGDRLYFTAGRGGMGTGGDTLVWPLAGQDMGYLRLGHARLLVVAAL